ncbi:SapC family protein [Bartonella sp. DGB2]|uniref:SapC family protein n=1 Tax=Bartonella sp. DGB2 TaxID=3388426 RepID=UPI0039900E98
MTRIMLLYKNIVPILRQTHKNLKYKAPAKADFADAIHWTPLAGTEYYQAARHYPILFMSNLGSDDKPIYASVALLGLANNENDYLNADKTWAKNAYIPAFIRRYPFILAENEDPKDLSVCIDDQSGCFNEIDGIPLFNETGDISPFLEERIAFLNTFKNSMNDTAAFLKTLEKMDLLIKRSVNVETNIGYQARLEDFWMVNEEKFGKLSGDQLAKLHKRGFLGWIIAHLMSLNNLPPLLQRRIEHKQGENTKGESSADTSIQSPVLN